MGSWYVSVTVVDAKPLSVRRWLVRHRVWEKVREGRGGAVVAPSWRLWTMESVESMCLGLSRTLGCPALAVWVLDSDVLAYRLFAHGEFVDSYISDPMILADYLEQPEWRSIIREDEMEDSPLHAPVGGDARLLAETIGRGDPEVLAEVLHGGDRSGRGAWGDVNELHRALWTSLRSQARVGGYVADRHSNQPRGHHRRT